MFNYFAEKQLTPALLREVSQHQIARLIERFDALDLDPAFIARDRSKKLEDIGGFLVLKTSRAAEVCCMWRGEGVWSDYRGDALRAGPAPYLSDAQLDDAMERLGRAVGKLLAR